MTNASEIGEPSSVKMAILVGQQDLIPYDKCSFYLPISHHIQCTDREDWVASVHRKRGGQQAATAGIRLALHCSL